jgi:hypothetical protein
MLLLGLSLGQIRNKGKSLPGLIFGLEEVAFAAALIKWRCLYEFLYEAGKQERISLRDFGGKKLVPPKKLTTFRHSLDMYGGHLTWDRARKDKSKRPKHGDVLDCGTMILREAKEAVDGLKCRQNAKAHKYYNAFVDAANEIL